MNQPVLFATYNEIARMDATYALDNYLKLIQWKQNGGDFILDIGCGTGDTLKEIIIPAIPENIEKIVAVDVSKEMLDYAKSNFLHPKISYEELDFAGDIPENYEGRFDHVVSFYCLHWIPDQRKCFSNVIKILKPGGDILVSLMQAYPIYDIYEALHANKRWKTYMEGFEKCVSPYYRSEDPEKDFSRLLQEVGFKVYLCKLKHNTYTFPDWNNLRNAMLSLNPFYKHIPDHLKEDYVADYISIYKKLNNYDSDQKLTISYSRLYAVASK